MSETPINKPLSSFPQSEKFNEAFGDIRDKAEEALRNPEDSVQKAQSLAKQYQPLLLAAGATYLLFKIEKRMVTKVIRKEVPALVEKAMSGLTLVDDIGELPVTFRPV